MSAAATPTVNEKLAELRRPFSVAAVKMKPQATTGEGDAMKGLVTYYVDSRLVVARLNAVVGADSWEDEYCLLCEGALAPGVGIPVQCSLTVLGVTKVDVGQIAPGAPDDKAWKSAYSDAFKRAAVKFEVAAYLYGSPQVWAPVKVGRNGKAQGFKPEGITQARNHYAQWIATPRIKELYGEPLDHGDADVESADVESAEGTGGQAGAAGEAMQSAAAPAAKREASFEQKGQITVLMKECAKQHGRTVAEVRAALEHDNGDLRELNAAAADVLIGKLERWAKQTPKAAAAAGEIKA
ncbi:MAG: Rad52/Rad22 family DNA repair protein [Gemmatimonadaceae bacterium]|nr:Rad52/Rad22 family DNA repair protein [Gemmatimonadaceae bacterium]